MKIEIIEQGKSGSLFEFAAGPFSASLWMNVPMVSLFADGKLIRACTMDEIEQIALYLLSMVETGLKREAKLPVSEVLEGGAR